MATINGFTAERMKEIEDGTIVNATIVSGDLVFTRHDGSTVNVGNVMGPEGDVGNATAEIAAALALADPPGTPKPYTGAAAPSGHGLCDAAVEYSSATYPVLAALYGTGAACVNGASTAGTFRLPNLKGRMLVGLDAAVAAFDTLHETGGSKDAVVVSHNHGATSDQAAHSHTADQAAHSHDNHPAANDDPSPSISGDVFAVSTGNVENHRIPLGTSTTDGNYVTFTSVDGGGTHDHGMDATDPGITVSEVDPGISTVIDPAGVSGVDQNLPPYRVVNWIMRLV